MPTINQLRRAYERKLARREAEKSRLIHPPSRKSDRPRCGAHARSTGKPCQRKALANGRCRQHGGLSTGPKTEEGKARALANLRQFHATRS